MKVHTPCLDKCLEEIMELYSIRFAKDFGRVCENFTIQTISSGIIEDNDSYADFIFQNYNSYLNSLDNLVDEIHQFAFKMGIDEKEEYFGKLEKYRMEVNGLRNRDFIVGLLQSFNGAISEKYQLVIKEEKEAFEKDEKRAKYALGETYIEYNMFTGPQEKTNTAYSPKHSPLLFNLDNIEKYETFLSQATNKFCMLADRYINLFNEGIFDRTAETEKPILAKDKIILNISVEGLVALFVSLKDVEAINFKNQTALARLVSSWFVKGLSQQKHEPVSKDSFYNELSKIPNPETIDSMTGYLGKAIKNLESKKTIS